MRRIAAVVLLAVLFVFAWVPTIVPFASRDGYAAAAPSRIVVTAQEPGSDSWPF